MPTELTARAQEWVAEVDAQARSGLSQRAWCAKRGIRLGTFAWWKHQLGARPQAVVPFVDVVVGDPAEADEVAIEIVLHRSGHCVRVRAGSDEGTLRRVVAVLETGA